MIGAIRFSLAPRMLGLLVAVLLNLAVIWLLLTIRQQMPVLAAEHSVIVELLPALLKKSVPVVVSARPAIAAAPRGHVKAPEAAAALPVPAAISSPDTTVDKPFARTAPTLNMDALRAGVRNDLRQAQASAAAITDVAPAGAAQPTALARELSKAQRASCGQAHANMGLLAPLAILKDTLTDTGCTWTP